LEQYRSAQRRRVWGLEQYRSAQRRRVWGLEQHRSAQLRRVAQGSTERRHEVVKNTRSPKTTTTGMTTTYNHQHLDYVGAKLKQQPMMSLPPASHSTTPTTSQSTPSMICITYGGPPKLDDRLMRTKPPQRPQATQQAHKFTHYSDASWKTKSTYARFIIMYTQLPTGTQSCSSAL